ncbi:MAG: ATP-binding protein [Egibacteraceae bacterium]
MAVPAGAALLPHPRLGLGPAALPGLESFIQQDAGVFFGREPQIAELLDRLHPTLPDQAHRFVAMIGPSGAGKSSLVQAEGSCRASRNAAPVGWPRRR